MQKKPIKIKLEFSVEEDNPKKDLIFAKFRELMEALKEKE